MTAHINTRNHLRHAHAVPQSTLTRDVAATFFDGPTGALIVLDGHRLEGVGGWAAVTRALDHVTTEEECDVFHCTLGDARVHPFTEQLKQLDGEFLIGVADADSDLHIAAPDWCCDEYDSFDPDPLSDRLSPFGSASLPRLARILAAENHMTGVLPLLLLDPASARPYASILRRQGGSSATNAVYEWLAEDLAVFASHRPNAVTVVASDARSPEWSALRERAALVLPTDR